MRSIDCAARDHGTAVTERTLGRDPSSGLGSRSPTRHLHHRRAAPAFRAATRSIGSSSMSKADSRRRCGRSPQSFRPWRRSDRRERRKGRGGSRRHGGEHHGLRQRSSFARRCGRQLHRARDRSAALCVLRAPATRQRARLHRAERASRAGHRGAGLYGDSTGPHLHFHVADAVSTLGAEGQPFVIDRFELRGRYDDIETLGSKRWLNRPANLGPIRRDERPSANAVVAFDA